MPKATRKTWHEKLHDSKGHPTVVEVSPAMRRRGASGRVVIAAPLEVDGLMRTVPRGKVITIDCLRRELARQHGVDEACPITTGIFAWIAAHAADEAEQTGKKRITPYWRTLKTSGELNPKYPGGIVNVRARLEAEGHTIVQKGKRFFVADLTICRHALS